MATQDETLEQKKLLCVGRCCYKFYATKIDHEVDESQRKQTETTREGILVCETCAHTQDVEFE